MSWFKSTGLVLASGLLLIACAQEEAGEGDDTDMIEDTTAVAPEPAAITLADVAGTWTVNAVTATGEEVPQFEMIATAEETGWEFHFPDREPVAIRIVEVAGDSIVTEAGPYESILRPGVQVTTHAVYRLDGDRLIGTTEAHYTTAEADSVVMVQSEGTRAP